MEKGPEMYNKEHVLAMYRIKTNMVEIHENLQKSIHGFNELMEGLADLFTAILIKEEK